jgi:uncharacterized protein (UPF0335 family)
MNATIGHNRAGSVAGDRLQSFVARIEKLEEERAALAADIREVYSEAKGSGFDVKIMRKVIALRKLEPAERAEMAELLDIYCQALGMLSDTPLGEAALQRFEAQTIERVDPTARKNRGGKK